MTLPTTYAARKRFFYCPSLMNTRAECRSRHPNSFRPLRKRQSFALEFNNMDTARVTSLHFGRCPSAIIRRIALIVIDAVNAILRPRSRPHIAEKVLKTMLPSFADGYAASAIVLVSLIGRAPTTIKYAIPNSAFDGVAQSVRMVFLASGLAPDATATLRSATSKTMRRNDGTIAAIALAQPFGLIQSILADIAKGKKPTKSLVGYILNKFTCDRDNFWGIIHDVVGPPRPLTKPGALIAPPGVFVGLLPLHYTTFSPVTKGGS